MSQSSLMNQLDLVEQQFNEVSVVLVDGDPLALENASAAFQRLTVDFIRILDLSAPDALAAGAAAKRVKSLAQGLSVLRANLLKQAAGVEQALKIVVPVQSPATYADSGPYSAITRQTGAFKYLAA